MISQRWLPQATAPMRQEPGEFMVEQAEEALPPETREQVPATMEKATAKSLGMGYGMAFGALYAALRPRGGAVLLDGPALGLGTWAVGYLGWLPGLKIMRPVTQHRPAQIAVPIVQHILYGAVVVAAYRWLRNQVGGTRIFGGNRLRRIRLR
jgi:hypothetical protein